MSVSYCPANETSEQSSNEYFNLDFVFTLDPTNNSFSSGIKVFFSIMNLYLFLNSVPSDLKSLSSLWFDMCNICYLLCNNMHSYRSDKWHRKCKQRGTTSVCLVEICTTLMKQIRFLKSG